MKPVAKEIAAGLAFIAIGVLVSLALVLVRDVDASPDEPGLSWVYRGIRSPQGEQCSDYEHDPDWSQYHIDGWQSCWHLTEGGYPAIDYTRTDGQTEDTDVWLDYEGDFQLFKIMPYEDDCTGVRAELYRGSYDPANYRGDIHYLHIEPNPLWLYQELPYAFAYIGDVTREDDPDCSWTGFHLHQSANASASYPFYTNGYEDPSQAENWEHAIVWEPNSDDDGDSLGLGAPPYLRNKIEVFMGTDPEDRCADNSTANNERGGAYSEPLSPWPPDFNDTGKVTSGDLQLFVQHYDNPDTYHHRYDLNASGPPKITSGDLQLFVTYYLMSCTVG
jgi:hypothetical protein